MKFKIGDIVGSGDRKLVIVGVYNDGYDYSVEGDDGIWHAGVEVIEKNAELIKPALNTSKKSLNQHYKKMPIQPIRRLMDIGTPDMVIGFLIGNIFKYEREKEGQEEDDKIKRADYKRMLDEYRATGNITLDGEKGEKER